MRRDQTEAELDALIAERMPTMPKDDATREMPYRRSDRPPTSRIRELLADGNWRSGRQIAYELGCTSRDVQQVVCNVIRSQRGRRVWLGRKKNHLGEYVYYLIQNEEASNATGNSR